MTTENAIKKVEKLTGVKPVKVHHLYQAIIGNEALEFHTQKGWGKTADEEHITCISTRRKTEYSDSMTDYFPQTWHDNITQAINFALRYA